MGVLKADQDDQDERMIRIFLSRQKSGVLKEIARHCRIIDTTISDCQTLQPIISTV